MSRLPIIFCALAVLGSAISAALFFQIGNSKQVLEQRLSDAAARATRLDAALAATNEQNGALRSQLQTAETNLARAHEKLTASDTRAAEAQRDLAAAKSVVEVYELTSRALAQEIAALRADLGDIRATHASPEAVAAYKSTIAELEKQLASARTGAFAPNSPGAPTAVFTSRAGRATVLNVGPESAFVVLNFGSIRGAKVGQKLSVSQGTSEVATVLISDVRSNFSVAQVLPDTLRGVLQKGDSAVLLR